MDKMGENVYAPFLNYGWKRTLDPMSNHHHYYEI